MKLKSGIYCIENLVNGKCYIGASKNIKARVYAHKSRLNNGKHINKYLQSSWNKYGEKNFKMYSVEFCEPDAKILGQKEKWWIDNMGVLDNSCGYNLSSITYGDYPVEKTEDHKAKIGKKSKAVLKKYYDAKKANGELEVVTIHLETLEKRYYDYKGDVPFQTSRGPFNFREKQFVTTTYNKSEEEIQQEFDKVQKRYQRFLNSQTGNVDNTGKPKYVKIYKVDKKTLEHVDTFDSIPDAANHAGTRPQKIRDCVSGLMPSYKGFIYTADLNNVEPVNYSRKRKIYDNGIVYNNWKEYSKATGLSKQQVLLKLRSKNHPDIYWIETPNVRKSYISKPRQTKQVKDNNGHVYESVTKAASTLNLVPKKIYEVLSGRANTTKGYSFQYV